MTQLTVTASPQLCPLFYQGLPTVPAMAFCIKMGPSWKPLGESKRSPFDKTGTLTNGDLQVVNVLPEDGHTADEVLALAASLETYSEHPIGEAIVKAAKARSLTWTSATQVQVQAGLGMIGKIADGSVIVGKAEFIPTVNTLDRKGYTTVWVAQDNQVLGAITLTDTLRPEAKDIVENLQQQGIEHVVMLTGDTQEVADKVAQELGIEEVYAELLPEDKLKVIRQLQEQYDHVAMVGDGINDAPALAMADVGIALGGTSTDVTLETAEVILMANSLDKLPQAIRQGQRANRTIKQNITLALSFIGLLLIANFFGDLNLPEGVIGHEGSTLMVTLSGLRLLKS